MNTVDIIHALKERKRIFKKMMKPEKEAVNRLRYKSRTVRQMSPHPPRLNWYTDRLQELELVLDLLEGKLEQDAFIHHLLDDQDGLACMFIGSLGRG